MKRAAVALGVVALAFAAVAYAGTRQVLVTSGGTLLPALSVRKSAELQNNGPDPICCAVGAASITGPACRIIAGVPDGGVHGGTFSLSISDSTPIFCKALGASQVDGGATILTEVQQ